VTTRTLKSDINIYFQAKEGKYARKQKGKETRLSPGWILSLNLKDRTASLFDENGIRVFSGDDDKFCIPDLNGYGDCINSARFIAWSYGLKVDVRISSGDTLKFEFTE